MLQVKTELSTSTEPSSAARQFCTDALRAWDVPREVRDQAELVVSELVGNAVKHAGGASTLELTRTADCVRIAVSDRGGGAPQRLQPGLLEEGGRGLFIVATVSSGWGHRPIPGGKTVWAELTVPAQLGAAARPDMLTH